MYERKDISFDQFCICSLLITALRFVIIGSKLWRQWYLPHKQIYNFKMNLGWIFVQTQPEESYFTHYYADLRPMADLSSWSVSAVSHWLKGVASTKGDPLCEERFNTKLKSFVVFGNIKKRTNNNSTESLHILHAYTQKWQENQFVHVSLQRSNVNFSLVHFTFTDC